MNESLLEKYRFKEFPFPLSPAECLEEAKKVDLWADLSKVKKELENFFDMVLSLRPSISALLYGWRGTGKTYSMMFFSKSSFFKEMMERKKLQITVISVNLDVRAPHPYKLFYQRMINFFSTSFKENIKDSKNIIEKEVERIVGSKDRISQATALRRRFIEELSILTYDDRIKTRLAELFTNLLLQNEKGEEECRKILGLEEKELSEEDIPEITSVLFNFVASSKTLKNIFHCLDFKIILWIDEWESIMEIRAEDRWKIWDFLRHLLDYVPSDLVLLLNVTLKPDETERDIPNYFTHQLLDRIGRMIYFSSISKENALEYVSERLKYYSKEGTTFPFTEQTLKKAVQIINDIAIEKNTSITPKTLNKVFSIFLQDAFYEGREKIDEEFIEKEREKIKPYI